MIIKKPYAFMIKHFRLIHLALTLLLVFILYKCNAIFSFWRTYAKNGFYSASIDLSSYINFYMFLGIIGILVITAFVYLLMRWKKKSRALYLSIAAFYIVLFIGLLVYFNAFLNMLNSPLTPKVIRAYRDIFTFLYVPQYIFVILGTIRALGFDIKKFDFKKDLAELDIAEADQEEVEVVFGQNNYKYKRFARRKLREFKYYVLENKLFFGIICSALVLMLVYTLYVNINVYSKDFKEQEAFVVNGVVFTVKNSYITNMDKAGEIINDNKKYIIVKVGMENTNPGKVTLDISDIRLVLDKKVYMPIYSKNEYFWDLGEGYYKNVLFAGESRDYLIIYEVPLEVNYKKAIFRLVDSVSVIKGEITARNKDVELKPINYMLHEGVKDKKVQDAIDLKDTTLLKSEVVINSYSIADEFTETYTYCTSECYNGVRIIRADTLGRLDRTILKLEMETDLDDSLFINKYIKSNTDFIDFFGKIRYYYQGKEYVAMMDTKHLDIETNNVYIEVPVEVKNAMFLRLDINIRDRKYSILLNQN